MCEQQILIYEREPSAKTRDRATGTRSTSNPLATAHNIISANPEEYDPVRLFRYPNANGPANPATLAKEFTMPTAAAAADSLRISVGIAQKDARNAWMTHSLAKSVTNIGVEDGRVSRPSNAIAAMNCGTAECQRRSRVLSECHPLISIA